MLLLLHDNVYDWLCYYYYYMITYMTGYVLLLLQDNIYDWLCYYYYRITFMTVVNIITG